MIRSPMWKKKTAEQIVLLIAAGAALIHLVLAGWYYPDFQLLIGPQPYWRSSAALLAILVGDFAAKLISYDPQIALIRALRQLQVRPTQLRLVGIANAILSFGALWPAAFLLGSMARVIVTAQGGGGLPASLFLILISVGNGFHAAAFRSGNSRRWLKITVIAFFQTFGLAVALSPGATLRGVLVATGAACMLHVLLGVLFFSGSLLSVLQIDHVWEGRRV